MKITLVNYGIAKDILRNKQLVLDVADNATLGDIRNSLIASYPEFKELRSLRFAVGDAYESDNFRLKNLDEVAVIPPVSGG